MIGEATISAVAPHCGVEVNGVDLRDPSPETMSLLRRALADHAVLFVRDQQLTPQQQVQLTRRFGAVLRVPYIEPLPDNPDVIAVLKEADERNISTFGGTWHLAVNDYDGSRRLLHRTTVAGERPLGA